MRVHIQEVCSQCPATEPKIVNLFTHELYCGRACFAEGQAAYARMIIKFAATEIENGAT